MRTTQYLLSTLKEMPNTSKITSHQLMLRAGIIRKLSSGLYSWLPNGTRVINKIKAIILKEMNTINALEIIMPIIQPIDFWNKSQRATLYGNELFKIIDRRKKKFILSPTHEEIITKLVSSEIYSYKQLPIILYQIQTKFRDEIRPRFGTIRSREFLMKDAYSFHLNNDSLISTYNIIHQKYTEIFNQMNIKYCILKADSNLMGGSVSHEFQAFSKDGENVLPNSTSYKISPSNFTKKEDTLVKNTIIQVNPIIQKPLKLKTTYTLSKTKFVKVILVKSKKKRQHPFIALLIRGDHDIDIFKIKKINNIVFPLNFPTNKEIKKKLGKIDYLLNPVRFEVPIIADTTVSKMHNFVMHSHIENKCYHGVNWKRDLPLPITIADIVSNNSYNINQKINLSNSLQSYKGIEIAHIFQIGQQYSKQMQVSIKNKKGIPQFLYMGCYGIGITRTVAAIIEQNHDQCGIIWPNSVAPFLISILPINMYKSNKVRNVSEYLYRYITEKKIDVLIDDRLVQRPGSMFAEMELIGIPHNIIVSDRHIVNNCIEYRNRQNKKSIIIKIDEINSLIQNIIKK